MFKSRWITIALGVSIIALGSAAKGVAVDDEGHGSGPMAEGRPHGGPGGPGPMGGPGLLGPIGEEQIDAMIGVLKDSDPVFAAKVEQARKNNQREVRELLAPYAKRLFMMAQLKKNDPELYSLKIEDFKLIQKIDALAADIKKDTKDGKPDEAKAKELKDLLLKQFDLRQQIQEKDVQRMEKQVQELKKEAQEVKERIERRKINKEQMLVERFKKITESSGERDW